MNRAEHQRLQQEIDDDRRAERRLLPLALVAALVVGLFFVVRWAFFV